LSELSAKELPLMREVSGRDARRRRVHGAHQEGAKVLAYCGRITTASVEIERHVQQIFRCVESARNGGHVT